MLHQHIEELTLNAWPALKTIVDDGWLIRISGGFTYRTNSISPLFCGSKSLADKIKNCEQLYNRQGQNVIFKITPFVFPTVLDDVLDSLGYESQAHSCVKILRLDSIDVPVLSGVWIEESLTDFWLEQLTCIQGCDDQKIAHVSAIIRQILFPTGFVTLFFDGKPVSMGMGVVQDGWIGLYEVFTHPDYRGRGFAREMLLHLLHWGRSKGAVNSYLQVVEHNESAQKLYDRLGYKDIYKYWYRCKNIAALS